MFRPLSQTKFINDANLVAYYKLEDVNDSKNSYHLTNVNTVTFGSALFDNGANFSATNKNLIVSNNIGIDGGACSISTWVKIQNEITTGDYNQIVGLSSSTSKVANSIFYSYNGGTRRLWFVRTRSGVADNGPTYNITMGTSNWYHLVYTYDGTNIRGYVNGVLVAGPTADSGNGSSAMNSEFKINALNNLTEYVDDTAIFSRALSAGEVAELYQSMTLGEYLPNSSTKLLLHLNGSSADSSGNNNNGTDTAITYSQANGKFGQGAGFNGSSSRINIADTSTLKPSLFSVCFWLKKAENNRWQALAMYDNGATNFTGSYTIAVDASNKISLEQQNGSATTLGIVSATAITDTNWHFISIVRNPSASLTDIYIDGVINTHDTSNSTAISYAVGSSVGFSLGAYYDGGRNQDFFNGAIDEVILENRAWSASEVKKHYTMTKGRFGII